MNHKTTHNHRLLEAHFSQWQQTMLTTNICHNYAITHSTDEGFAELTINDDTATLHLGTHENQPFAAKNHDLHTVLLSKLLVDNTYLQLNSIKTLKLVYSDGVRSELCTAATGTIFVQPIYKFFMLMPRLSIIEINRFLWGNDLIALEAYSPPISKIVITHDDSYINSRARLILTGLFKKGVSITLNNRLIQYDITVDFYRRLEDASSHEEVGMLKLLQCSSEDKTILSPHALKQAQQLETEINTLLQTPKLNDEQTQRLNSLCKIIDYLYAEFLPHLYPGRSYARQLIETVPNCTFHPGDIISMITGYNVGPTGMEGAATITASILNGEYQPADHTTKDMRKKATQFLQLQYPDFVAEYVGKTGDELIPGYDQYCNITDNPNYSAWIRHLESKHSDKMAIDFGVKSKFIKVRDTAHKLKPFPRQPSSSTTACGLFNPPESILCKSQLGPQKKIT